MFALFTFQPGYAAEEGDISESKAAAAEAALTAAAEASAAAEKAAAAAAEASAAAEKAVAAAAEAVEAAMKAATAEVGVPAETAEASAAAETAETSASAETAETSAAAKPPTLLADIHQADGLACSDCHTESPPAVAVTEATCLTCHGDYRDFTAGMYDDPHNGHIAFQDCGDCHHAHQESVNQCLACHGF